MRTNLLILVAGLLLAAAAPVLAEDKPSAGHASPAATGDSHAPDAAHAEPPRPPLLSFEPGTAIWTILVFVVLLLVLRGAAWKPILNVLREREEFIARSITDARREREEADKLLAQYREQIERARVEATALVDEGKRDAEAVRRRLQDEARKEADETLARARREIALAKDTAIKELYDKTAELAVGIAGGIIRKELRVDDHHALVSESLQRMDAAKN